MNTAADDATLIRVAAEIAEINRQCLGLTASTPEQEFENDRIHDEMWSRAKRLAASVAIVPATSAEAKAAKIRIWNVLAGPDVRAMPTIEEIARAAQKSLREALELSLVRDGMLNSELVAA